VRVKTKVQREIIGKQIKSWSTFVLLLALLLLLSPNRMCTVITNV